PTPPRPPLLRNEAARRVTGTQGIAVLEGLRGGAGVMAIRVRCACGRALTVRDESAGKKGRCPACQQVVRVPRPAEQPEPEVKAEPVVVWTAPETGLPGLVALTPDSLCLAPLVLRGAMEKARQELEGGRPPEMVMKGAGGSLVPL